MAPAFLEQFLSRYASFLAALTVYLWGWLCPTVLDDFVILFLAGTR